MKKTIITIISLVVVLAIVTYAYEFIFKKPIIESPTQEQQEVSSTPIEIKEQYKNSTYTFVGSLSVPTPCHTLTTKVNKVSDSGYQIEVTTQDPPEGQICAQVISEKSFKTSFVAPENITVTLLINGVEYPANRFEVPLDQNIDTYEFEFKG
jgi:hypothetical protein